MPSINFDTKIVLAVSVGYMLCVCSTKSVNLEIYLCIGSSYCLNVVSLCLAIVEFSTFREACKRVSMTGQFLPAECNSLTYLCSDPLEVVNGTF